MMVEAYLLYTGKQFWSQVCSSLCYEHSVQNLVIIG